MDMSFAKCLDPEEFAKARPGRERKLLATLNRALTRRRLTSADVKGGICKVTRAGAAKARSDTNAKVGLGHKGRILGISGGDIYAEWGEFQPDVFSGGGGDMYVPINAVIIVEAPLRLEQEGTLSPLLELAYINQLRQEVFLRQVELKDMKEQVSNAGGFPPRLSALYDALIKQGRAPLVVSSKVLRGFMRDVVESASSGELFNLFVPLRYTPQFLKAGDEKYRIGNPLVLAQIHRAVILLRVVVDVFSAKTCYFQDVYQFVPAYPPIKRFVHYHSMAHDMCFGTIGRSYTIGQTKEVCTAVGRLEDAFMWINTLSIGNPNPPDLPSRDSLVEEFIEGKEPTAKQFQP